MMLWVLFWLMVSMFAVLGLLEAIVTVLELIALRKVRSIRSATFRVELIGEEENVEYLLNTLCLMAERLDVGPVETRLEIVDAGLESEARQKVLEYCKKNPWVRFTEGEDNAII